MDALELNAALATPLAADGTIDEARMIDHARDLLGRGLSGVTLFGTTGEGASVDAGEALHAFDSVLGAGLPAERVGLGVLQPALQPAIMMARHALEAGGRLVLVAPPFFFKEPDEDGLFAWYAALIEALGSEARDLVLYNIPQVTAVELSLSLIDRLATAFPKVIVGVKDSSGNWPYTSRLLEAKASSLRILIGDERQLPQAVGIGAGGAISGMLNVCPELVRAAIDDKTAAAALSAAVDDLLQLPVIPAIKGLVAAARSDDAWRRVRPPLSPVSAEAVRPLHAALGRAMDGLVA